MSELTQKLQLIYKTKLLFHILIMNWNYEIKNAIDGYKARLDTDGEGGTNL